MVFMAGTLAFHRIASPYTYTCRVMLMMHAVDTLPVNTYDDVRMMILHIKWAR